METAKLIEKCIEERRKKERTRAKNRAIYGEDVYVRFVTWCYAFKGEKAVKDPKMFSQFLKEEKIQLNFWQKKYLAENYFGFSYNWNMKESKWEISK